jgi:hypothetical protein
MTNFLLWLLLLVICWPIALAVLLLYPLVWLLLLPFRLVGITFSVIFDLFEAILRFPIRLLREPAEVGK